MKNKEYQIGDEVTSFLYTSTNKKKVVKGYIKSIKKYFGISTYVITNGVVEDFPTRTIK